MALEVSGLDCGAGNGKDPEEGRGEAAAGAAKQASKNDEFPGAERCLVDAAHLVNGVSERLYLRL